MVFDNITSEERYILLSSKTHLSLSELGELVRYPFVPLCSYCTNLSNSDKIRIKEIEDKNIYYFFKSLSVVLGNASKEEIQVFQNNLTKEPLRSAVIISRTKDDPVEKYISFVETACKILLSINSYGYKPYNDSTKFGIAGSMPRDFLKSRQEDGNKWFNDFVTTKLKLFRLICEMGVKQEPFPILTTSIAYSLYHFTPKRYNISNGLNESDAIYVVMAKFLNLITN